MPPLAIISDPTFQQVTLMIGGCLLAAAKMLDALAKVIAAIRKPHKPPTCRKCAQDQPNSVPDRRGSYTNGMTC